LKGRELDPLVSAGLQDLMAAFRDDDNVYSDFRATTNLFAYF
jgi:hypothetical protein